MSWQTEMTVILRYMVGDFDDTAYKYTDENLQTLLSVSARFVKQDIIPSTTYTIDVSTPSISPDPTVEPDDIFINFTVLKAACLTDEWSLRSHSIIEGINAVCGPARMGIDSGGEGFNILITNGPCEAYKVMKMEYGIGNINNIKAILSPFVSNEYQPIG